jgi:hypothetical protein
LVYNHTGGFSLGYHKLTSNLSRFLRTLDDQQP